MISNRQLFLRHVAQTSDAPLMLEIEKAEGVYLFDANGKKYLDLISGISVSNIGHRHPAVLAAIHQQLDRYMHLMVYGEYVQSPQVQLATALSRNLPSSLNSVYFLNSGAEVTEAAMKLAKRFSGKSEIIACYQSYHGSTQGALSLNSEEYFKNAFRPLLPDIRFFRFNQEEDLTLITEKTACVFIEPVQGEAGYLPAEKKYLKKLRERTNETGTLLIFDEIQTGFGRTGSLFAFEQYDVVPDMLMLAKGMGGGMPIGALVADRNMMQAFTNDPYLGHITTFGGHPVSCASALAVLNELTNSSLVNEISNKEALFRSLLSHPAIHSISGKGLMLAVEFDSFETTKKIIDRCIEKGLITDWFLFATNKLRISPPLTITCEQIEWACGVINESISEICKKG